MSPSGSAASAAPSTCRGPIITAPSPGCAPGCRRSGMGVPPDYPEYVLHQMVTVTKGGEEVKISKRAGSYVTVRELIDDVGRRRGALLLPHAQGRLAADLRCGSGPGAERQEPGLLRPDGPRPAERDLSHRRSESGDGRPEISTWTRSRRRRTSSSSRSWLLSPRLRRLRRASASRTGSPPISTSWPPWCTAGITTPARSEPPRVHATEHARLLLARAARTVLANGLGLLGISAPDRM